MCLSDMGAAWEMRKAETGFTFPPLLAPSRSRRGSLSTMETTPAQLGLWGWWRAGRFFQGALDPWEEAPAWGPGRQPGCLPSTISRQRS